MKKFILIVGSIITLILAILWYGDIISEPFVAVGTGILTLLTLIFVPDNDVKPYKNKNTQKHYGKGDNVAGNKIIKK